ncbi:GNAT family N-acetyltransferase [Streptomyces sp. NPDC091266]|uniref:GNAT family N-acetyltransferase n=1 Tax=Streptomyces sp. NPDC091266 TaxID=3365978 RepID=UPI0037F65324
MEPVTLTSERLILRPFAPEDTAAVHAACQEPDIPRWTNVPSPYGLRDARHFIGTVVPEGWRDDTAYSFAVLTRAGSTLVGAMGLVRLDRLHTAERQAELGFWTAKQQRGKEYTAEAARAVARWAFRDLGVERLEWIAEAGNEGSRAVARKVGFHLEGTLRAKLLHDGTRRDAWIGSLLPCDLHEYGEKGAEAQGGGDGEPSGAGADPTPYLPYPR